MRITQTHSGLTGAGVRDAAASKNNDDLCFIENDQLTYTGASGNIGSIHLLADRIRPRIESDLRSDQG